MKNLIFTNAYLATRVLFQENKYFLDVPNYSMTYRTDLLWMGQDRFPRNNNAMLFRKYAICFTALCSS